MSAIINSASAVFHVLGGLVGSVREAVYAFALSIFSSAPNYSKLTLGHRTAHVLEDMGDIISERKTSWISLTTLFGYHTTAANAILQTFEAIEKRAEAIYAEQQGKEVMDHPARAELEEIRTAITSHVETIKELQATFPHLYKKIEGQLLRISPLYHSFDAAIPYYGVESVKLEELFARPKYAQASYLYTQIDNLRWKLDNAMNFIKEQQQSSYQAFGDEFTVQMPISTPTGVEQNLRDAKHLIEAHTNLKRSVFIGDSFMDSLLTDDSGGIKSLKTSMAFLKDYLKSEKADAQIAKVLNQTVKDGTEAFVAALSDGLSHTGSLLSSAGGHLFSALVNTVI